LKRETTGRRERSGSSVNGLGRERADFLSTRTTALLSGAGSFVCLGVGVAGFTGYVLPHAAGPASVFMIAALAGFAISIIESRKALTPKYTNEQIHNIRR
jgi:hypothetical protein